MASEIVQEIEFNGLRLILTSPDDSESAIATVDAYKAGRYSYAHLMEDGSVMQHGSVIGTQADITFGERITIQINPAQFASGICGESWPLI